MQKISEIEIYEHEFTHDGICYVARVTEAISYKIPSQICDIEIKDGLGNITEDPVLIDLVSKEYNDYMFSLNENVCSNCKEKTLDDELSKANGLCHECLPKKYTLDEFIAKISILFEIHYQTSKSYHFEGFNDKNKLFVVEEGMEDLAICNTYSGMIHYELDINEDGGNITMLTDECDGVPGKELKDITKKDIWEQAVFAAELCGYDIEGVEWIDPVDELRLDSIIKDAHEGID